MNARRRPVEGAEHSDRGVAGQTPQAGSSDAGPPSPDYASPSTYPSPEETARAVDLITRESWRLEHGVEGPPEPAPEPAAPTPFKGILLAVDGSDGGKWATAWAREIAAAHRSQVWCVSVATPPAVAEHYLAFIGALGAPGPSDLAQEHRDRAHRAAEEARDGLRKAGIDASAEVGHGAVVRTLVEMAAAKDADLVVLGSHRQDALERALLGSVADGVKNLSHAHVLIAKGDPRAGDILIPIDGSRSSKRAAGVGLALAAAWGVRATLMYVLTPLYAGSEEEMEALRRNALEGTDFSWTHAEVETELGFGLPADEIERRVRQGGIGLVVMGSRGLSGLRSLVAGSVSNQVAHRAQASVLLVRSGEGTGQGEGAGREEAEASLGGVRG